MAHVNALLRTFALPENHRSVLRCSKMGGFQKPVPGALLIKISLAIGRKAERRGKSSYVYRGNPAARGTQYQCVYRAASEQRTTHPERGSDRVDLKRSEVLAPKWILAGERI